MFLNPAKDAVCMCRDSRVRHTPKCSRRDHKRDRNEPFLTGADRFLTGIDPARFGSISLLSILTGLTHSPLFTSLQISLTSIILSLRVPGVISHKGDFLLALLKPTTEGAWSVAYENINTASERDTHLHPHHPQLQAAGD